MSKTWRRVVRVKDCTSSKGVGRWNRNELKRIDDTVPNGNWYKKLIERWDWNDWNWVRTPQDQSYDFHHPLTNHYCICDPCYNRRRRVAVDAPNPVLLDRSNWVLPAGYEFRRRWNGKIQRVNPATGDYEYEVEWFEWRYFGSKPCGILQGDTIIEGITEDEEIFLEAPTAYSVPCQGRKATWRQVRVCGWVHNDTPEVYRVMDKGYFTVRDVERHVASRESQTRDYRMKKTWPRYWRRDRKRARRIKGIS